MSIAAIIDRMETIEALVLVEAPSRTNPLERDRYPVATVYPSLEVEPDAAQEFLTGQQMEREYLILLTVDSPTALETARDAIVANLTGYKPTGTAKPMRYIGGKVEQISGALIQWSLRFATLVCYA
jgi:hypothetical protein